MTTLSPDSSRTSVTLPAHTATLWLIGLRFDWIVVALSSWLVGGAYLDGWAHNHNIGIETFFTPWHAILYSGFLVCALWLLGTHVVNLLRGNDWGQTLPAHYELSLLGVLIFALGGVIDLGWHTVFGIERSIEALFSPPHHALVLGIALIVSGPWRAAWHRNNEARWSSLLPMLLSVVLTWSIITFIAQGTHPFAYTVGTARFFPNTNREREIYQLAGVMEVIVQTMLMMGVVLLLVRRWWARLPLGTFTLLFTLNGLLILTQRDEWRLLPTLVLGGLSADLLLRFLQPSLVCLRAFRSFAFSVPLILYALYFVTLIFTDQVWWRVHSITGTIFAAGMTGWLVSYLLCPPTLAEDTQTA